MSADGAPEETNEQLLDQLNVNGPHLLKACETGDLETATKMLEENLAPAWYADEETGWTALHYAAACKSLPLVLMLLQNGCPWNAIDANGITAGEVAISVNDDACYQAIKAEGTRAEFLLAVLRTHNETSEHVQQMKDTTPAGSSEAYLNSKLTYVVDSRGQEKVLAADGSGVMMGWETPIMEATVARMMAERQDDLSKNLAVLNVGFGLGIIDKLFQGLQPVRHVIIEAHPDVLKHMKDNGWYDKPGVEVLEGRWQDFAPGLSDFDLIYWDTFAEHYHQLHDFFEILPNLVRGPESVFSFFHGLGATNSLFYDVYTDIAELAVKDIGLSVEWSIVKVSNAEEVWEGVKRSYWTLPRYNLPIAKFNVY